MRRRRRKRMERREEVVEEENREGVWEEEGQVDKGGRGGL